MKPVNSADRRNKILGFSLILLTTLGIAIVILTMVWPKSTVGTGLVQEVTIAPVESPARFNVLLSGNDLLAQHFASLQQLDDNYASLLTESNDKNKLDSVSQLINTREELFHKSLDSIFTNMPVYADSSYNKLSDMMVLSYKSILQNRNSIRSLRNVTNLNKKLINPDEMAFLKTQKEIQEKNMRIASLESSLKSIVVKKENIASATGENFRENIAMLNKDLSEQRSKVVQLTTVNNNLKQDNEKLIKQNTDASKTNNTSETFFKNKSASLQQKIDVLNAEMSLALVDCNLSRVDAGKIIYTQKQRKLLLSEASGILTGLVKSDDVVIKKKALDKITRLNQVAANTRD